MDTGEAKIVSTRNIQRTRIGRWVPGTALVVAIAFSSLAFLRESRSLWSIDQLFVVGCFLAIAAVVELLVMRQWKFVARAVPTEIIVDEVRPLSWSKTHMTAQYHFFTEDRRVVSACCAVSEADRASFTSGARLNAIYDPIRPARHALVGRPLWAVTWEPATAHDESFDQAVAAMVAITPRRAA